MGVKGFFHPKIGGGCPSFMPFLHIAKGLPSCLPSSSLVVNFQSIGANFQQNRSKMNKFLGVLGVFSGKSETKNGKSEIYFGFGAFVVLLSSSFVVAVVVSTCGRWCAPAPSLWVCSAPLPFLCPLSCFACGALHLNMALFRILRGFLEGFMVRMYICTGCGLCVDCGAFVCVRG